MTYKGNLIHTGNDIVDEVGMISLTGNLIANNWYSWILRKNGRPNLLAINILAEIVHWYRPVEIRDEESGRTTGYRKKFKGDRLQKSYEQLGRKFGEEKATVIHFDELGGKAPHPHKIFTPLGRDEDGCPVLNAKRDCNLKFFIFMNQEYPVRMRERGYPVLDCEIYEDLSEKTGSTSGKEKGLRTGGI